MPKLNYRYDNERYNSEYKQRIGELIEFILEKDYGTTILHRDASRILHYNIDIEEEFKKYKSVMGRIKNYLVDYSYILKSVGNGYYILKPKQIAGHCYHTYITKTMRMLEKSDRILNHTDKTELNEVRQQEHKDVLELNTVLDDEIWESIQSSGYYSRKNYYDALKDD